MPHYVLRQSQFKSHFQKEKNAFNLLENNYSASLKNMEENHERLIQVCCKMVYILYERLNKHSFSDAILFKYDAQSHLKVSAFATQHKCQHSNTVFAQYQSPLELKVIYIFFSNTSFLVKFQLTDFRTATFLEKECRRYLAENFSKF